MNYLKPYLFLALCSCVKPIAADELALAPFAVVEMFTSESCSSCPPADKLLAEIADEAKRNNRLIFPLELHVDYWNHLGWEDPFSLPIATKRQQAYGRILSANRLYTPQMVVNGTEELIGSDRDRARRAIDAALVRPAKVQIILRKTPEADGWKIEYETSGETRGAELHLALVESGLATQVTRGENRGRTLTHANVVRTLQTVSLEKSLAGDVHIDAENLRNKKDVQFIVFVQSPSTLKILGASRVAISSAETK